MADEKITELTAVTSPADADLSVEVQNVSTTPVTKKITWTVRKAFLKAYFDALYMALVAPSTDGNVLTSNGSAWVSEAPGSASGGDGWTAGTGTWSYSSADAPTFVISVNNDQTAIIGVGQRIKLTQTTAKYFIVTAVGAYGAGATLITVYGGTDYTLTEDAITTPFWSNVKAPFGFPLSPAKWTVTLSDTSNRAQSTPTQNQWYNLGSLSLSMPIGVWAVDYAVILYIYRSTAQEQSIQATMSTANNSESNAALTIVQYMVSSTGFQIASYKKALVSAASKTLYYFNSRANVANITTIAFQNANGAMVVNFLCAYL